MVREAKCVGGRVGGSTDILYAQKLPCIFSSTGSHLNAVHAQTQQSCVRVSQATLRSTSVHPAETAATSPTQALWHMRSSPARPCGSPDLSPNFLKLGMGLSMSSKVRGLWYLR